MSRESPQNILVIRLSSLGDIVLTTPVYQILKRAWPKSRISVLVKKEFSRILEGNPWIDEVICFSSTHSLVYYINKIRKRKFDLIIDLHNNIRSNLITFFAQAKEKIKYKKDVLRRIKFVKYRKNPKLDFSHTVERYLEPLGKLGIEPVGLPLSCNISKILVVQTAFLGDAVLTIPLLEGIRKRFSESYLAVLCIPTTRDIFRSNLLIDEIITYDKKVKDKGLVSLWKLVNYIKSKKFDLAILPHRSFKSAFLCWLAGIPWRIGFDKSEGRIFLNQTVIYNRGKHDLERNLDFLKIFDEKSEPKELKIYIGKDTEKYVENYLKEKNINPHELVIGINPGSAWPTKCWLPERFGELINRITSNLKFKVLVLGTKNELNITEKIFSSLDYNASFAALNLVGQTDLKELFGFIKRCGIFITNDSGPMHIATALKIPVIAIFGPTTRDLGFYPYGRGNMVIEKELPCRPCSLHGSKKCRLKTHECMEKITVEEVFQAVEQQLKRIGEGVTK